MTTIKSVRGFTPELGEDCFLSDTATLVGDVKTGNQCSFWFNTVVRGDVNSIRIGNKVNVQDGAVIHCTYQQTETHIGNRVSIGHNAIVHGCEVGDNVLIGMGATVMDRAEIAPNALIAAGAVVLEGTQIESGSVYAGVPAKKVKELTEERFKETVDRIAENYTMYAGWYQQE
jgi:carbonic anhydrase/acetyltransferase-like protein (isoleucine patch superfamily)